MSTYIRLLNSQRWLDAIPADKRTAEQVRELEMVRLHLSATPQDYIAYDPETGAHHFVFDGKTTIVNPLFVPATLIDKIKLPETFEEYVIYDNAVRELREKARTYAVLHGGSILDVDRITVQSDLLCFIPWTEGGYWSEPVARPLPKTPWGVAGPLL